MSHCYNKGDKIIKIGDPKSSEINIENDDEEVLEICLVDGVLIQDNSRRCDKLIRSSGSWIALIEFKGRDVESAADQLFQTLGHSQIKCKLESKRLAVVVSKTVRVPSFDNFMKKQKQRFAKDHKSLFRVERSGRTMCPKRLCSAS